MKDEYTEKVFKFFTDDAERFVMMGKIAEHESKVTKQLIEAFWGKLKDSLEQKFKELKSDWKVRFSENFSIAWNKVIIYREAWCFEGREFPLISVAFEDLYFRQQPFIGILVDINYQDFNQYNTDEIKNRIRNAEEFASLGIDPKGKWYPVRRNTSISLTNHEALLDILPENEEKTLASLMQEATHFTEILDSFMKENENLKAFKIEKELDQ